MFKIIENKIKEIAFQIHNSTFEDKLTIYENSKQIYELAIIHKFLSERQKNSEWEQHSEKLKEALSKLNLHSEKLKEQPNNDIEIKPLIDTIKYLVTEIPESEDDK